MGIRSVVCTLFEGHYQLGVAALVNSLHSHGFRGAVYAGYRGALPPWSAAARPNPLANWPDARTLSLTDDVQVHFLPLQTDSHLTNYKPTFMLDLWDGPVGQHDAIAYFDPDIVVKCRWAFYERWMEHGVALVHEIVSNDMPATHPIRLEWKRIIAQCQHETVRDLTAYINGGFCGVAPHYSEFVRRWAQLLQFGIDHYGSDPTRLASYDKTSPFNFLDQDALNMAAMCCPEPISEIGPEGMDFAYGGRTMSHATGSPKPWKKHFLRSALSGAPPSLADKQYWLHTNGLIKPYTSAQRSRKQTALRVASLIGRFYRKT